MGACYFLVVAGTGVKGYRCGRSLQCIDGTPSPPPALPPSPPAGVLQVLAEIPCAFAANPPECMTLAVYGLAPGDPEDDGDDEL